MKKIMCIVEEEPDLWNQIKTMLKKHNYDMYLETDFFEAIEELEELRNFISEIFHDFKSPLTSILLSVSILELIGEKSNQEDIYGHLMKIQKNVRKIVWMLDDILYLIRLEENEDLSLYTEVDLKEFCEQIFFEVKKRFPGATSFIKINLSERFYKIEKNATSKIIQYILSFLYGYNTVKTTIFFTVGIKENKIIYKIYHKEHAIPEIQQNKKYNDISGVLCARHVLEEKLEFKIFSRMIKSLGGKINFAGNNRIIVYTFKFPIV